MSFLESLHPDAKKFVVAAREGNLLQVQRLLLQRNVNVNAFYCGATALMLASLMGMNDTVLIPYLHLVPTSMLLRR